jgi:hypothetical protein
VHDLGLGDFLAKDEVGKNEIATAVAATARIKFLIMFIGPPFAKALTCSQWPEHLRLGHFSIGRGGKNNENGTTHNNPWLVARGIAYDF